MISGAGATVSYLGPAGTYTEEAAQFFFPGAENMMPKGTVDEAIAEVINGTADYAVIPQENTLGGAAGQIHCRDRGPGGGCALWARYFGGKCADHGCQ